MDFARPVHGECGPQRCNTRKITALARVRDHLDHTCIGVAMRRQLNVSRGALAVLSAIGTIALAQQAPGPPTQGATAVAQEKDSSRIAEVSVTAEKAHPDHQQGPHFISSLTATGLHDAAASYGNYDTSSGNLYVTGGLTPTIAADLAAYGSNQDRGFGTNEVTGHQVNKTKEYALRTKWLFTPSDNLSIRLSGDTSYTDDDGLSSYSVERGSFINIPGGTPSTLKP